MRKIGIIGGGAWGTALALVLLRAGSSPLLWAREAEVVEAINSRGENPRFLPGIALDAKVRATNDLAEAARSDAVLLVPPAQFLRAVSERLAPLLAPAAPVVICAKGIECGTSALMSEVVADALPGHPVAVLSGPTFADEVARGLPTAVTLACRDVELAARLARAIGSRNFRTYLSGDVIGAELGGAVKNVLAIACGITIGRGLGENARAALITRGLVEMMRLGAAKGAKLQTLMGLSGLGDLSLTCNSAKSRNASLGLLLGRGVPLKEALAQIKGVSEGVYTAEALRDLGRRLSVELPICMAVDRILNFGADIDAVIEDLLARPFKEETPELPVAALDRDRSLG